MYFSQSYHVGTDIETQYWQYYSAIEFMSIQFEIILNLLFQKLEWIYESVMNFLGT